MNEQETKLIGLLSAAVIALLYDFSERKEDRLRDTIHRLKTNEGYFLKRFTREEIDADLIGSEDAIKAIEDLAKEIMNVADTL